MQDWLTAEMPVDLRPDSVDFLRRLAMASEHRDQVERQLALDAQLRAAQHANELVEVEDVLQQCGLAPHTLPNSITSSLGGITFICVVPALCRAVLHSLRLTHGETCADTLTSSAVALCTRDTALCSLYGAYDFLEVFLSFLHSVLCAVRPRRFQKSARGLVVVLCESQQGWKRQTERVENR
jgi:hypothetical protein